MKPSIGKNTEAYLQSLESQSPDAPDFYIRQKDMLDQLIEEQGLRIRRVYVDKELDLFLVLLNSKKVIKRTLSDFPRLAKAAESAIYQYETDGLGIHWPEIDEDLSLKGFLAYELAHTDLSIRS